tara:strand:+ start:30 stop:584 length:555 start_codon:yes stop_codon:yes gene_type:complete
MNIAGFAKKWSDEDKKYLSDNYTYNETDGKIYWKQNFSNTRRDLTIPVKGFLKEGYHVVTGNKKTSIKSHRLAWFLYYNEDPPAMIDHIDINKTNNRINNLRKTDPSLSQRNKFHQGIFAKGVEFKRDRTNKPWCARVHIGEKKTRVFLGYFYTEIEAAKAYDQKVCELYGEENVYTNKQKGVY